MIADNSEPHNERNFDEKDFESSSNASIISTVSNQKPEILDDFKPASEIDSNTERLSTGATSLDKILKGGLETSTITQIVGQPGSGKTQLCFTLCAVLPSRFKCMFIDTEGTFRPERIQEISRTRETDNSLQNILVKKVSTTFELENCLEIIDNKLQPDHLIKLIIIDSIMNLHRVEYSAPAKLSQRQQRLNTFMFKLRHIAQSKSIAVAVTNQVYSNYALGQREKLLEDI